MKSSGSNNTGRPETPKAGSHWLWVVVIGCLLVPLIAIFLPRPTTERTSEPNAPQLANVRSGRDARTSSGQRYLHPTPDLTPMKSPEEIVADKVGQFGRKRRELARAIARRLNQNVPAEVEAFFDAIEAGNWENIHSRWQSMANRSGQFTGSTHAPELDAYWATVHDAYGVAEQAHDWPAQPLLDYGNAVLDSLRPGMIYVGGTDNGRWIPELLNETSGGEPHVMLTQNALADARYLEFVDDLYGGQLATLSKEDSQRAFKEYVSDAQKRLEHDRQFPDEPKQVRPGETISDADGRVQVSGQVAVMSINEKLLEAIIQKNPGLSFALQESFPLKGTYGDAVPLGPLMELNVSDAQSGFTAERAAQSLDYWRTTAQNLLADPEASGSPTALKSYSHDANSAANLLAAHDYAAEAEQAYRLSSQLWPGNPEAAGGLATILSRTGRPDEARQLLDQFSQHYPDQRSTIESFRGSITFTASAPPTKPSP